MHPTRRSQSPRRQSTGLKLLELLAVIVADIADPALKAFLILEIEAVGSNVIGLGKERRHLVFLLLIGPRMQADLPLWRRAGVQGARVR